MKETFRRYLKISINIFLAILTLLFFIFVVPKIIWFFMPFFIGWIVALIAAKPVRFLGEKLKIRRKAASAVIIVMAIALVMLIGYGIIAILVNQLLGFVGSIPLLWEGIEKDFTTIGDNISVLLAKQPIEIQTKLTEVIDNIGVYITESVSKIGTPTISAVGNFAKNIPSVIIGIIMCVLSAYFFVAEKDYVYQFCKKHTSKQLQYRWNIMFGSLKSAVGGYFKAQFKIEIWIYLLILIGLLILEIPYAPLIALGMALLDFLPFFGTGIVLLPWTVIKFLSADYKMAIGLVLIWAISQLVRQFIQPKIVGDSIGMKPIPTLFLLYIGYKVAGMLGMILAVPIGIILVKMDEAGVFDTPKNSLKLLFKSINRFRALDQEDLKLLHEDDTQDDVGKEEGKE